MARYFKVKNFERFQHYKDRNPLWIKLYNGLLDDYEFSQLADATKWHLCAIWLLASRYQNRIPLDSKWLQARVNATEKVDLGALAKLGFIEEIPSENHECSNLIAETEQVAIPEIERETEKREKKNGAARFVPPTLEQLKAYVEERKLNVDPDAFVDYFESVGWKVGKKGVMTDWKSAARNWSRTQNNKQPNHQQPKAIWN